MKGSAPRIIRMKLAPVLIGIVCLAVNRQVFAALELASPDGNLVVTFETKDIGSEKACAVYRLAYRGKEVLRDSRLGLELEPAPFRGGFTVAGENRGVHDETWKPVC